MVRTFTTWLLLAALAWAPIPLASNREWSWCILGILIACCLLVNTLGLLLSADDRKSEIGRLIAGPAALMGAVVVWSLVQIYLPVSAHLSSETLSNSRSLLGGQPSLHIAINSDAALSATLRLLTYICFFYVAAQICREAATSQRLCIVISSTAVVITILGIMEDLPKDHPLSGTFVNPDNYATYAGFAALIAIFGIIGRIQDLSDRGLQGREKWRSWLEHLSLPVGLWGVVFVIVISGMLYSRSRSGLSALAIATPLSIAALMILQQRKITTILWALAITFTVGATAFVLAGERMLYKWAQLVTHGDPDRIALFQLTTNAIRLRPFTGWGLDSFASIFSYFQPPTVLPFYVHAHNLYLETASELGLVGASIFFLAVGWIAFRCLRGMRSRSRDSHFPGLAFAATAFVGLHSLVDFGAQIPANAATYATLLGLGWAQSWSSRQNFQRSYPRRKTAPKVPSPLRAPPIASPPNSEMK